MTDNARGELLALAEWAEAAAGLFSTHAPKYMRIAEILRAAPVLQCDDDGPCFYCGEPTRHLAGDPGKWPLRFCQPDGTGITRFHHTRCVISRLATPPSRSDAGSAEGVKKLVSRLRNKRGVSAGGEWRDPDCQEAADLIERFASIVSLPSEAGREELIAAGKQARFRNETKWYAVFDWHNDPENFEYRTVYALSRPNQGIPHAD